MNDCEAVRNALVLRPDEWNPNERRQVEYHLTACPECATLAHAYAEQDRLIRAAPRVRLTPSQRAQLLSSAQREERRHKMRARLSTVFGTAAVFVALFALTCGLYLLFRGQDQPTVGSPPPTIEPLITLESTIAGPTPTVELPVMPEPTVIPPLATLEAPVFADEIRIDRLTLEPLTGEPISFTLRESDLVTPLLLGEFYIRGEVQLTLNWQVATPPDADWVAFVHLMSDTDELVMQSDGFVDWPDRPCPAGEPMECTVTSEHEWVFPPDFTPGLYTIVAGLYDPESGNRAPVTTPAGTTPTSVTLGNVQVLVEEPGSERTRVTLLVFSGRPNPSWSLTQAQDAELMQRLNALAPADRPFDEYQRLGYAGFGLLLPAIENQPQQNVEVFDGIVRVHTDDLVTLVADENRALERWLLDTAAEQIEDEVVEMVRKELETPSTPAATATHIPTLAPTSTPTPTPTPEPVAVGRFAIYLTSQEISAAWLSQTDLISLELEKEPIISSDDILGYTKASHEINLTSSAIKRINQLSVPVDGRGFVVSVGSERIYGGAFWTLASSLIFDGVVIEAPLVNESMRIQLGYPESLDVFKGEDPRSDVRIMQALEQAGKLE